MLTWAGRGVAMGQAPAEVVAAADEVTHSVHDDGAAHVLRSLL
jgi:hydroxymethylpyrimidine pyrophosphatase-like HAD family hydrolase